MRCYRDRRPGAGRLDRGGRRVPGWGRRAGGRPPPRGRPAAVSRQPGRRRRRGAQEGAGQPRGDGRRAGGSSAPPPSPPTPPAAAPAARAPRPPGPMAGPAAPRGPPRPWAALLLLAALLPAAAPGKAARRYLRLCGRGAEPSLAHACRRRPPRPAAAAASRGDARAGTSRAEPSRAASRAEAPAAAPGLCRCLRGELLPPLPPRRQGRGSRAEWGGGGGCKAGQAPALRVWGTPAALGDRDALPPPPRSSARCGSAALGAAPGRGAAARKDAPGPTEGCSPLAFSPWVPYSRWHRVPVPSSRLGSPGEPRLRG